MHDLSRDAVITRIKEDVNFRLLVLAAIYDEAVDARDEAHHCVYAHANAIIVCEQDDDEYPTLEYTTPELRALPLADRLFKDLYFRESVLESLYENATDDDVSLLIEHARLILTSEELKARIEMFVPQFKDEDEAFSVARDNLRMVGEETEDMEIISYADSITEWSDFDEIEGFDVQFDEVFK